MPTDTIKKNEQRHQLKKTKKNLASVLATAEFVVPRLQSTKEILLYSLLVSTAFLAMIPEPIIAKPIKNTRLSDKGKSVSKVSVPKRNTPVTSLKNAITATNPLLPSFDIKSMRTTSAQKVKVKENNIGVPGLHFQKIYDNVLNKMKIAPEVRQDPEKLEACAERLFFLAQTIEELPTGNYLEKVLTQNDFSLFCLSKATIDHLAVKDEIRNVMGAFRYPPSGNEGQHIAFPVKPVGTLAKQKALEKAFIRHEFWHARNFQLHSQKPCQATKQERIAPFFPIDTATMDAYERALDQGDQRIKAFATLRWQSLQQMPLTQEEQQQLLRYQLACQQTLAYSVPHRITKDLYTELAKLKVADLDVVGLGTVQLEPIRYDGKHYLALVTAANVEQSIILMPDYVQSQLSDMRYHDKSRVTILAERDAYTRQILSDAGLMAFYPEAVKMHQDFETYCTVTRPSPMHQEL